MTPPDSGVPLSRAVTPVRQTRMTLHLGVLVQPYRDKKGLTTYDVARFLEDEYGVMAAFYRVHQEVIAGAVEKSLERSMESLLMGAKRVDLLGPATQIIQREFKNFISSRAVESVGIAGIPTKAALRGVSHRRKHPYAKSNPRRPSFRDTGLYLASSRVWSS